MHNPRINLQSNNTNKSPIHVGNSLTWLSGRIRSKIHFSACMAFGGGCSGVGGCLQFDGDIGDIGMYPSDTDVLFFSLALTVERLKRKFLVHRTDKQISDELTPC